MKEILKELRTKNRYSQELLAKVLGISRQAYMKYESDEVEPSIEIIRKLSKIYNVPYDVLIDNKTQQVSIKKQKNYSFNRQASLSVASPISDELTFCGCAQSLNFSQRMDHFQNLLLGLLDEFQTIKDQANYQENINIQKSKSFNKEDFFKQTGKIEMDSSYVQELREESKT